MVGMLAFSNPPLVAAETPEGARADDVALISGQTNGSKSANLFAGFASPASTVATVSGIKYLTRTDTADKLLLTSTYDCRDSEVTTWFSKGIVFLRLTGGKAIYFSVNVAQAHDLRTGLVTGFDETALSENSGTKYQDGGSIIDLSAVPGWSASYTAGDLYTFGCAGFDVYVKYKGVEILRYKEWCHVAAGHFAVWQQAPNGLTDTTVHYVPATLIGSNRALQYFDIRDFGAKSTATASTTGSISASSSAVSVASAANFAIGDYVIVEIGGEAGLGARGTAGVGGTWPLLSYASTTAMNADSSKAEQTYAWDTSTGLVYIRTSGAWVHREDGGGIYNQDYYTAKALPKALRARITGIAGLVLTLDTAATTTATNANVYVDCANSFNVLTDTLGGGFPAPTADATLAIPGGQFAVGAAVAGSARDGLSIRGAGRGSTTLFSPKGTLCISLVVSSSIGCDMRDFKMLGNHGAGTNPDGYQLLNGPGSTDAFAGWPTTLGFNLCTYCAFQNVLVQDVLSYAYAYGASTDCWAHNCDLIMSASLKQYTQWFFEAANCTRGGFVDCSATGPKLMKCFETFSSLDVKFIRCGGTNVLASTNSSGGYVFEDFHSTLTIGCYDNIGAGFYGEPVINVNANAFPGSDSMARGGTIANPRIIQQGYVELTNNESMVAAIQIQPSCPNVTVSGQYPNGSSPFSASLGGYFEAPNYAVVDANKTFATLGSRAALSDAVNTTITGIRNVGSAKAAHGGIELTSGATGSHVSNDVTDALVILGGTVKSNCQTNAGVAL